MHNVYLRDFTLQGGEPFYLKPGESVKGIAFQGMRLDSLPPGSEVVIMVRDSRGNEAPVDAEYRPHTGIDHDDIREALEGDSNDAEHDALVAVAEALGIEYEAIDY